MMMIMMMMNQQVVVSRRPVSIPFFPVAIVRGGLNLVPVLVGRRRRPTPTPKGGFVLRASVQSPEEASPLLVSRKEKRELRHVKREERRSYNWREDVEERLLQKPKKRFNSWKEELNLDKLSVLGPQWWILKVSRAKGKDTVQRMMQALHNNFPDAHFEVFDAAVYEKSKLKNGKISVKPKPLYPGCVFLHCILNRELHNFIREDCQGVGGFVGRMVGNTKRQINKPRPVSKHDMESIFQEVKEKQEAADKAFEQDHSSISPSSDTKPPPTSNKTKSRKSPLLGSTVTILSGDFADFSATINKLDKKRGLATVGFALFGKDTIADVNLSEIVQEQK